MTDSLGDDKLTQTVPGSHLARTFRKETVGVCLASTVVSGFFGLLAPDTYYSWTPRRLSNLPPLPPPPNGLICLVLGAVIGVAAGWVWAYLMRRLTVHRLQRRRLTEGGTLAVGTGLGALVGTVGGVLLHLGLSASTGFQHRPQIGTGLCFGIPAGLFLGLICGQVWYGNCVKAHQRDGQPEGSAPPESEAAP